MFEIGLLNACEPYKKKIYIYRNIEELSYTRIVRKGNILLHYIKKTRPHPYIAEEN